MKGKLTTIVFVLGAMLVLGGVAYAEGIPSRTEYVAQVDPICKANSDANKSILKNAGRKQRAGNLKGASRDVMKVAGNFAKTLTQIEAVPRPPEDSPRLEKWFGYLKILNTNLRKLAK